MKKMLVIWIYLIAFGTCKTYAQSDIVNLNMTLSDVVSLTIPTNSLAFNFNSQDAYTNGITTTVGDYLDVLSSRNYKITVQAGTVTRAASLTPGTVTLQAGVGASGGNYTGVSSFPSVTLSSTTSSLITSNNSSFDATHTHTKYNVLYLVGANRAYIDKHHSTDNVISVIYTIIQP